MVLRFEKLGTIHNVLAVFIIGPRGVPPAVVKTFFTAPHLLHTTLQTGFPLRYLR